jgi:hypothetical protein
MAAVDLNFNYDTVDVKQEMVDAFKLALPKFNYATVKVLKADPQSPAELPCIGINRANDDETSVSMADFHGADYDATTKIYTTTQGTFFSESMEIRVWHTNADERNKLYNVVRAILFAYRQSWVAQGLINVTLRAGRDEQDSSMSQAPTVLYWSVINMMYLNPLNVDVIDTVDPISAVPNNGIVTP